jgi:hypothetical protein
MGVSLCAIVIAIAHHPYFFGVTRMGMQMRVACCSLMYKKVKNYIHLCIYLQKRLNLS